MTISNDIPKTDQGRPSLDERHWEVLTELFKVVQSRIAAYDEISFKIKGLAVTAWSLLVGFAVTKQEIGFLPISQACVAFFWLMDFQYKVFQEQFIRIGSSLEGLMRNGEVTQQEIELLSISKRLSSRFFVGINPSQDVRAAFRRPWFHTLYIGIELLTCTLYFLTKIK